MVEIEDESVYIMSEGSYTRHSSTDHERRVLSRANVSATTAPQERDDVAEPPTRCGEVGEETKRTDHTVSVWSGRCRRGRNGVLHTTNPFRAGARGGGRDGGEGRGARPNRFGLERVGSGTAAKVAAHDQTVSVWSVCRKIEKRPREHGATGRPVGDGRGERVAAVVRGREEGARASRTAATSRKSTEERERNRVAEVALRHAFQKNTPLRGDRALLDK
jgi:hypothetical protein